MQKINQSLIVIGAGVIIAWAIISAIFLFNRQKHYHRPIKVGILHSCTGSLAVTEKPLASAALLAIEEINKKGGVLGRRIEAIVKDGKSDDDVFKEAALELIEKEKVKVIFGVFRSTTRKMMKDIVEAHDVLFFYPAQDEGLDESPNVIYTGSMPNQVVLPAITWSFLNLGKRFYLVGTDSLFQHVVNDIVVEHVQSLGGEIIGQEYVSTEDQIKPVIDAIVQSKPDVIVNTLDAKIALPFVTLLRAAGISSSIIPTISFSFSETELQYLGVPIMIGDYAAWTYFQTIYREENLDFISLFQKKYGKSVVISANMESAYINVHLWAQAVQDAHTTATKRVRSHLLKQSFDAPGSVVYLDNNLHLWRTTYIGKIRFDGQFDIVWDSKKQIRPLPYPPYKTKPEWKLFADQWYKKWKSL